MPKVRARERLGDDRHLRRRGRVAIVEVAPCDETHLHRPEVATADRVEIRVLRPAHAVDNEVAVREASADRHVAHQRGALDARDAPHALEQLAVHGGESAVGHAGVAHVHFGDDQVVPDEPGVERRQVAERSNEQQRADDERQRQRDLHDDEQAAQLETLMRVGRSAASRLHHRCRVHARGSKRRDDTEDHARRRCDEPDERVHAPVVLHREEDSFALRRDGRDEHAREPLCEQRAGHGAAPGEERALGRHLPHNPAAGRAEREPHRHLALARDRARQHQVRQIRAGDQQDEGRCREEQPQRCFEIGSHVGNTRRGRKRAEAERQIDLLVFGTVVRQRGAEQDRRDRFQVRRGARQRPARFEPAHRREEPVVPLVQIAGRMRVRLGAQRHGDIEGAPHLHAEEVGRRDADDLVQVTIERQRSTEHRRAAAVLLLPETVADHSRRRRASPAVVGRGQQPPDQRMHVERGEEIAAHPDTGRGAADTARGQLEIGRAPGEHVRKRLLPLPQRFPERVGQIRDVARQTRPTSHCRFRFGCERAARDARPAARVDGARSTARRLPCLRRSRAQATGSQPPRIPCSGAAAARRI